MSHRINSITPQADGRAESEKLSCDVCHASLVTDAASAIKDQSYHLLFLRNNGGQVIPSEGTVRVVRAADLQSNNMRQKLNKTVLFKGH
ncbi:unnamed protein product [Boreogadus saida]